MGLPPDLRDLVELAAPVDVVSVLMAETEAAVVAFDAALRITWLNERAAELLAGADLGAVSVLGRALHDIPLDDHPSVREAVVRWHHRLVAVTATCARSEHLDDLELAGERRGFRTVLVPRLGASGEVIAVIALARSVAAPLATGEGSVPAPSLDMVERLAALSHIAAGITHEVSNPLTAIYGNLELALGELACLRAGHPELADAVEAIAEPLTEARGGAERIGRVVEDIALLGHGDGGGPRKVDLREVVRAVLRLMGSDLAKAASLAIEADEAPFVAGPAARVGLLVSELVLAAMGSLPARPTTINTVGIAIGRAGQDAILTIADNGTGAPLGPRLGVVRHLVAGLGGRFELESTAGAGTLARVILPGLGDPE